MLKSPMFRRLHKLEFQSTVPKVKPKMNIKHRLARVLWCKEKLFWKQKDWESILLSDEFIFKISVIEGGIRIWRLKGEAFEKSCIRSKICDIRHGMGMHECLRKRTIMYLFCIKHRRV